MRCICLALGCWHRHRHRFRPVYRDQATAEIPGVQMVCDSRTMSPQLAGTTKKCQIPFVSQSGAPIIHVSKTKVGSMDDNAKTTPMLFPSHPCALMDFVSHSMSGTFTDSARNSRMPLMSDSGPSSASVFIGGPFMETKFSTLADARKNPRMPLVLNTGDPKVSISKTMSDSLAGNATNHGKPSASHSGGLVDLNLHAIFIASASPAKCLPSMSNAGAYMDFVSHSMPGALAVDARNSGMPVMSHSGSSSASLFGGKFLGTLFPTLAGARKNAGMPLVPNTFGTSISLISSRSLGRSFSTNAGSHSLHDCPEDHIVEHLPDAVEIGDNVDLKERISAEEDRIVANISGFKDKYAKFVKPILASRCLIAPAGLNDPSTVFLHHQTHKIVGHYPRYLNIFDIMSYEDGVSDPSDWTLFLEHLTKRRVYIIEDIDIKDEEDFEDKDINDEDKDKDKNDLKLCLSSIETLIYDHGIKGPDDGTDVFFYRGECDASFVKGKGTLSYIIWKDDSIIFSEIYKNVDCKSITEAEAFAAFALLSKARELKVLKLLLYSDCESVCNIISGQLLIGKNHPHRNTYLMLRSMRRHFKNLIATWKPRELMSFVDDLAKLDGRLSASLLFRNLKTGWASTLNGSPLFRIEWTETTKAAFKKFAKTHIDESFGTNPSSVYFVEVEEKLKLECLEGINQSMGPSYLVLYVSNTEDRSPDFIVDLKKIVGKHIEKKFESYSSFTAEYKSQR